MSKVMILTKTEVGTSDQWMFQNPNSCTQRNVVDETPYRKSLRTRLLARRAVTTVGLPTKPLDVFRSDQEPHFCGVWSSVPNPKLPRLGSPQSSIRSSKPTKAYYERLAKGDIVINPMRTTSLKFHDMLMVKPGAVAKQHTVTFMPTSMLSEPVPRTTCGFDLFRGPDGNLRRVNYAPNAQLNYGTHAHLRTTFMEVEDTDVTSQSDFYGITSERIDFYRSQVDQYVADLQRDTGLITQVVGDTRAGTYDILTDVAEAKSTFQLIFSLVIRFFSEYVNVKRRIASKHNFLMKQRELLSRKTEKAYDAAQRRELRRISKEIQDLSDEWLQFRYGISPLLKSLDDAVKWLKDQEYEYAKFRGTVNFDGGFLDLGDLKLKVPTVTDRAFGKVRVDSVSGGLKINPIATALELVPLSFLLNWVCNIGDYVSALWPPQGVSQEVFTYSRSIPAESVITGTFRGVSLDFTYGHYRIDTITPYEGLAVKLDLSLTWKRIVDAFALAYGPLRRAAYSR